MQLEFQIKVISSFWIEEREREPLHQRFHSLLEPF